MRIMNSVGTKEDASGIPREVSGPDLSSTIVLEFSVGGVVSVSDTLEIGETAEILDSPRLAVNCSSSCIIIEAASDVAPGVGMLVPTWEEVSSLESSCCLKSLKPSMRVLGANGLYGKLGNYQHE